MSTDPLATVRACYVGMLEPFVGRGGDSPAVAGLHIEPHPNGGAFLVATNRHILAIVHDVEAKACDGPYTFTLDWAVSQEIRERKYAGARCAFDGRLMVVTDMDGDIVLAGSSSETNIPYVKWRKAIPELGDDIPGAALACSTECLAKFRHVGDGVILRSTGALNPIVVTVPHRREFIAVLMPRRDTPQPLPEWLGL